MECLRTFLKFHNFLCFLFCLRMSPLYVVGHFVKPFLSLDLIPTLGVYDRRHIQKVKLEDFKDKITSPSQITTTLRKRVVLRFGATHKFYSRRKISNIRSKHRESIGKKCERNEPILIPHRFFFSSRTDRRPLTRKYINSSHDYRPTRPRY